MILKNNGKETAFIGQCGYGPENEVYLITYSGIMVANNPKRCWINNDCSVYVDKFVDIEMIVREKF